MRTADVFVLSSAYEGFGNALVEAMAAGIPVISTDCPHGPREILRDGDWGKLIGPGDPLALANALDATLSGDKISAAERGREFSVTAAGEQYLKLLKELCETAA
jgi:glycosyltransferase involved in cell wall biosynthesis